MQGLGLDLGVDFAWGLLSKGPGFGMEKKEATRTIRRVASSFFLLFQLYRIGHSKHVTILEFLFALE